MRYYAETTTGLKVLISADDFKSVLKGIASPYIPCGDSNAVSGFVNVSMIVRLTVEREP